MRAPDYTRDDLVRAIRAVGIGAGDVVSLQVSLGRLGLPVDTPPALPDISNLVIDAFLEVLGPRGTLIVPTYTYSIGRGEVFEVETTPSSIGEFPEVFRKRPGVIRSRDPMLSTAGLGPAAETLLRNISRSCYGEGSTYHRLREAGATICTLGLDLHWATFRHHIEEMADVPFRFRKLFPGVVREHGVESRETWIYFAAPLVDCCQPMGIPLEQRARAAGLVRVARVGRGELVAIGACEYFAFGLQELRKDPWLTAKGPACSREELVRLEDERVGARVPDVTLAPGASMTQMVEALWRLPRDLVSAGYDAALAALARQIPMAIHEYPTGSECWTWIVPEKWTCREAYLEALDGRRLFSYADNPLHVASYSHPFQGVVTRDELFRHLHVHPILPDATPYQYLFYKREWGLCCSRALKEALTDERYRVLIDTDFSYGTLKVGNVVVPGEGTDGIVLCAHLDHPGQVNDGLAGCVAGIEVMRALAQRGTPRFTYRLLIVSETIGSLAYLSHNEDLIPRIRGGIFLDMVGLDNPITLQHSAQPESIFDRCCERVLRSIDPGLRTGAFLEVVTNDDRQFNAPGIRVPMISLSRVRTPVGKAGAWLFDEYHSNRDDPALVPEARLRETVQAVLAIIDAWEQTVIPRPLFRGEVFLSRYGIHYDYAVDADHAQAIFEVMHALDGIRSTADIASHTGRSLEVVARTVDELRRAGLVAYPDLPLTSSSVGR